MRSALFLASVASLTACAPSVGATGDTSRPFSASGFDAVRLAGSDNVQIVRGTTASVVARGPADLLDRLDIRTEGNTLVISRKPTGMFGWSRGAVTVTVIMPLVRAVELTGSGNLSVDRADGAQFEASLTGSGNLSLASVESSSLKLRVTGSGDAVAAGRARTATYSVTGSGNLSADKLLTETASLSVKGSGNVSAHAGRSATLAVAGSGNASVRGTRNCSISKSGSGDAGCTL